MSRLMESTLTGKISKILIESENEKKICPRCGKTYTGFPATSRYDNETEICSECGTDEAMIQFTGGKLTNPHKFDRIMDKKEKVSESVEDPTPEEIEADEKKLKEDKKKVIENRIGELRQAIADGVADDERQAMENEIRDLENQLNTSSSLNESNYEESFFAEIEEALINAGFDVRRYTDAGMITNNLGWVVSSSEGEVNLTCAGTYLDESDKINESVTVEAVDGSTVTTDDAASVNASGTSVSITNGSTTITMTTENNEPANDLVPEGELDIPTEEVPVEEPTEEIPVESENEESEEEEEPEEIEEADELDDEYGINATVEAKSLSVLKNQGDVYMLQIEESNGKTSYWVCRNFNQETNEGENAEVYDNKEAADDDYFDRVGLDRPVENEE